MVRGDVNLPSVNSLNIFEKNVKCYSKRVIKSNIKIFNSETEACEYFYTSLIDMLKEMGVI
ncbi:hypothetical protein EXW39_05345 [Bacillus mycoides]|uniref:Uncharacterized protein n=1 Tax=Bacillus mycoides (strain KBAB4) TaxID=315730 RepID=A9VI44_BACMK|nr:hypothetical protein [Bacillus mycoides]ABY42187.1 hypothetical protein BcerKBAB4_0934 [Bacillus mycoides KBAB4]QWG62440.1 hypothetical protein EXW60_16045 [Bacillus mycoides]QWG99643.1 hypothetical protein EXW52_05300 [Bacillus mycoides]QWH59612.1 hypothetical protein EXW39_05345 [Bacillus mycoides]SCA98093.1 Uncharacterized protein BWINRA5_01492 [Bacillus mycoides]